MKSAGTLICLLLVFALVGCEKKRTETKAAGANELIPVTSYLATIPIRGPGSSPTDEATDIEVPRGGTTTATDRVAADASGDGGGRTKILKQIFENDPDLEKIVTPNFLSTALVPGEEILETLEMPEGFRVMRLRVGVDLPSTTGIAALRQVRARFKNGGQVAIKDLGSEALIEQRNGSTGITVRWSCEWEGDKLASLRLIDFQEAVSYTHLTLPTNREG